MSLSYSIMAIWLMCVTPTLHWQMFREQRSRTALNFMVRMIINCSYLFIMVRIISISPGAECPLNKRRSIMRWFDLTLVPIVALTVLSDVWL